MISRGIKAPELTVASWLNTNEPLQLEKLRGQVVVIDKDGTIRFTQLGRVNDMQVGNMIGRLLA